MQIVITIEVRQDSPLVFPGYRLRTVKRNGTTFKQWYMTGPRSISLATKRAEGR